MFRRGFLKNRRTADTASRIVRRLGGGGIFYRLAGKDKPAVLRSVVEMLRLPDKVDREFLLQVLLAREALESTAIGDGIAIPHVRNPIVLHVPQPMVTLCFLEAPVDFGALDGQPVQTLFTLISPTVKAHLHLLSRLAFALRDPDSNRSSSDRRAGMKFWRRQKKSVTACGHQRRIRTKEAAAVTLLLLAMVVLLCRRGGRVVADEPPQPEFFLAGRVPRSWRRHVGLHSGSSGLTGRRGPAIAISLAGAVRRIFH